ncbi:hypothetical protein BDR03DRAFT_42865 [Suillus americanus]|nr:hypothetical protein BDR03DRAFT_42865 [Suillus americanus]
MSLNSKRKPRDKPTACNRPAKQRKIIMKDTARTSALSPECSSRLSQLHFVHFVLNYDEKNYLTLDRPL